jgi:hypothetical protein
LIFFSISVLSPFFNHGREFGCYSEGANLLDNRIEVRDIEECVALCLQKPGKTFLLQIIQKILKTLSFLPFNRKHFCLLASLRLRIRGKAMVLYKQIIEKQGELYECRQCFQMEIPGKF